MKKYSKLKESGIEWIGNIPKEWNIDKVKYHYDIISGKVLQSKQKESDEILVDYITAGNVLWEKVNLDELSQMWSTDEQIEAIEVKNQDLLICEGGEAGRSAILTNLKNKCIIQNHIHRVRSKNNSSCKFLMYLMEFFSSSGILKTIIGRVTISSLPRLTLENFPMITPVDEQKQISEFLDKQITKIDSEILKNQILFELMEKKRQSIINHAVTNGLDNSVSTQDSGIERIGNFPKKWELNKIKFVSIVKGRIGWQGLRSEEFTDEGSYLITGTDFHEGAIDWKTCNRVEEWRYDQDPHIQIKEKDILITKDGTIGKIAFVKNVPDKTTLNSGVMVVRPKNKKYEPSYLFWLLKSNQFIEFIEMIKSGSTVQHLYQETFENFQFTLPDTSEEQKSIADFLDDKINLIDKILLMVSNQIKKLKELRQSLISSAVTGKIDVRETVA